MSKFLVACTFLFFSSLAFGLTEGVYETNNDSGHYDAITVTKRGASSYLIETCAYYGRFCVSVRAVVSETQPGIFDSSQANIIARYGNFICPYDIELTLTEDAPDGLYFTVRSPKALPNRISDGRCPRGLEYQTYIEPARYGLKDQLSSWSFSRPESGQAGPFTAKTSNVTKQASLELQCEAPSTEIKMVLQVDAGLWSSLDQKANIEGQDLTLFAVIGPRKLAMSNWQLTQGNLLVRIDPALAAEISALKGGNALTVQIFTRYPGQNSTLAAEINFSLQGSSKAISRLQGACSSVSGNSDLVRTLAPL